METSISNSSSLVVCVINLLSIKDKLQIFLTVITFIIAFLYIIFMLLFITIKKLHKRQMFLLINLNCVGILYITFCISFYLYTNCFVPTRISCFIQAFMNCYTTYNIGYAIAALALYKLIITHFHNINQYLRKRVMLLIVVILWVIPCAFPLVHIYGFNYIYYTTFYTEQGICLPLVGNQLPHLVFFGVFNALIPNIIIISGFLCAFSALRKRAALSNSNRDSQSKRVKLQLFFYVAFYELDLLSCIVIFCAAPQSLLESWMPYVPIFLIIRQFNHFNSLAMMYFHPAVTKYFKNLFKQEKIKTSQISKSQSTGKKTDEIQTPVTLKNRVVLVV